MTGGGRQAPVFLIGAARSGTSLLYKSLCLHPGSTYISNWVQRYPRWTQLAALNHVPRRVPPLLRRAWFRGENAYVYGEPRPLIERLTPAPAEGETVFRRAGVTTDVVTSPPPVTDEVIALRRAFDSLSRWSGDRVLITKRIANNWRLPLLVAAFPDARFVEIVRDGRAVSFSLSRVDWWSDGELFWLGMTPAAWEAHGGDPMELCARNWVEEVDALERGLAHVPPDQHLRISYEEFVAGPHQVLAGVAGFVGLDADSPQWREWVDELRFPNRNERWRRELAAEDVRRIESFQIEALDRYGYEPATTTAVQ